jgi:NAD(P)-dependent dehydrogenase (short-subunit alcohol dehydrogenase family)
MNTLLQQPAFDLTGRVALLTGAGRGIGLGIARAMASFGAAVAIQDIDVETAGREAAAIVAAGGKAIALGGDVTDLSLPEKVVGEVTAQLGRLDILVNNAAIQSVAPWTTVAVEDVERQYRANIVSPLLFSRLAAEAFRRSGYGRIINIGSVQGRRGSPNMLAYSMSKAALANFNSGLARSLAKEKFTVNLIAPGWINTYRNRADFPDEQTLREKGKHIPLGRVGEPEDFGGIAVLLASEAGSFITGQVFYVDGGSSNQ